LVDTLRNAAASATVINGEAGLEHSGGPERSAARICARSCGSSLQFGQELHAGISPVRESSVFDRHGLAMLASLTQCTANPEPKAARRAREVLGSMRLTWSLVLALQFARAEKSEASRRVYRSDFER